MSGDSGTWNIHTNHTSLRKALPYYFDSTSKQPNTRCLISKFLSAWFLRQAVIPSGIRNKYFGRLRALLLQQWTALQRRLQSKNDNNKQTKTFIKFSYKHTTFYLGFYISCQHISKLCSTLCAVVLSNDRACCHLHESTLITTPTPPPYPPLTSSSIVNRRIISRRHGFSWNKTIKAFRLSDLTADSSDNSSCGYLSCRNDIADLYDDSLPSLPR